MLKRLLALGVFALITGALVRYFSAPTPAVADVYPDLRTPTLTPTGSTHLRWEVLWTQDAPRLVDLAIARNGSSVAWVDNTGSIRRIDTSSRRTLWQSQGYPGINTIHMAPQGTVLAYSRLNPASTTVRILDATVGPRRSVLLPVEGAIWSAAITPDGTQAVVGTGSSLLYSLPLRQDAAFAGTPMKVPGIPETVQVSLCKHTPQEKKGDMIALLGTWQDGGVSAWGLDNLPRWVYEERQPDYAYSVVLSEDGSTAAAVASRGPHHEGARLHVWDMASGKLLFIEDLHGMNPRVAISGNGKQIAVSYTRDNGQVDGGAVGNGERKISLFDRTGRRLFEEKGSVFFSPELVGISADGARLIVRDPQGTIWTLDGRGQTTARLTQSDKGKRLLRVLTTADGDYLLLYRSDGTLTLYHAVPA